MARLIAWGRKVTDLIVLLLFTKFIKEPSLRSVDIISSIRLAKFILLKDSLPSPRANAR